jgi:2-polyprenyl-3-methyl-5-hydroxy-6-metoxy-1,4-benzoquinol methylase
MDRLEQLRHSWIANAEAWTNVVREHRIESRRLGTDRAILDALDDQHPRRVLDLGCGEGWLCRALRERGIDSIGVDASQELIDAANELGGVSCRTLSYDEIAADPAVISERIDVVAANFALFDEKLEPLLNALHSILSEEGTLVIQTIHPAFGTGDLPYVDGWREETFASFEGEFREAMPWYFRTISSWLQLLADTGFAIAEIREPMHPETGKPLSIIFIAKCNS